MRHTMTYNHDIRLVCNNPKISVCDVAQMEHIFDYTLRFYIQIILNWKYIFTKRVPTHIFDESFYPECCEDIYINHFDIYVCTEMVKV